MNPPAAAATGAELLTPTLLDEVVAGLRLPQKALPPKFFYDERGSALFEAICELDEYYLTRTELTILRGCVAEIATLAGPRAALVEYGSGAGTKVTILLEAFDGPAAYVAIDISPEQLGRVTRQLAADYPGLFVHGLCADFAQPLVLPPLPEACRRVAFFPGSTIGNFHPGEAVSFLRGVKNALGPGGGMILGVDRRKNAADLEAAYDDARGVTAEFNLNLLVRLNRELGSNFDLGAFHHRAVWNDTASRIEMHLVCRGIQRVELAGETFEFRPGETIWTESSYKYDQPRLENLVAKSGFRLERLWTDAQDKFWIAWLNVA